MDLTKPIYIRACGRIQGPFNAAELQLLSRRGKMTRFFQLSNDQVDWRSAAEYPELFPSSIERKRCSQGTAEENRNAPGIDDINAGPLVAAFGVDAEWHYTLGDEQCGPVSAAELQHLAVTGRLQPHDYVWTDGMAKWTEVGQIAGLLPVSVNSAAAAAEDVVPSRIAPMAIASLVAGLLGASLLWSLASIPAIVFGHLALRQIAANPGTFSGRRMAITGLILGYVIIVVSVIGGLLLVILSNGIPAALRGS